MGRKREVCVNQLERVEWILANGFENKGFPTAFELKLISRYWRKYNGWGDDKIHTNLVKFCEKHYYDKKYFPYPIYMDDIHKASIDKRQLFISNNIVRLTKTELEIISQIDDVIIRKMAFGILCLSKRTPYDMFDNEIYGAIEIMGLKLNKKEFLRNLYYLEGSSEEPYITYGLLHTYDIPSKRNRNERDVKIKVLFREYNEDDQDVVIVVDLAQKKGGLIAYNEIFPDDLLQCESCGDWYRKSKQATKQVCCENCAEENKRRKTAERQARFRNKNK